MRYHEDIRYLFIRTFSPGSDPGLDPLSDRNELFERRRMGYRERALLVGRRNELDKHLVVAFEGISQLKESVFAVLFRLHGPRVVRAVDYEIAIFGRSSDGFSWNGLRKQIGDNSPALQTLGFIPFFCQAKSVPFQVLSREGSLLRWRRLSAASITVLSRK